MASRLYELAKARESAEVIDIDAALALSRASVRTLMAMEGRSAELIRLFVAEEIDRLDAECTEESQASIALLRDAVA